ncbi:alkaline phosphatase [Streptomyces sp. NPDC005065]|uniref:alkaline phosphatase n=1 Tax=Streptomyces sp. NPDC005065 TaxID=3154461 RepID=UPI00339F50ED
MEKAQKAGYSYVNSASGLSKAKNGKLLGLFSNEEMFQQRPEGQGDVYSPVVDLGTMTSKALSSLDKNKKGFFLMVEEEGTDEFAHSNNGTRVLQSMQQLEKAVAAARRTPTRCWSSPVTTRPAVSRSRRSTPPTSPGTPSPPRTVRSRSAAATASSPSIGPRRGTPAWTCP